MKLLRVPAVALATVVALAPLTLSAQVIQSQPQNQQGQSGNQQGQQQGQHSGQQTPSSKAPSGPTATQADLDAAKLKVDAKSDTIPEVGDDLKKGIKKGSIDDVDSTGTRDIGGRGVGNWFSQDWEVRTGKGYAMEVERSSHMITDPVVNEYVNRVGQNIVKNSDCKVPFTIKVIDSDEINAMALPGGYFYVNSGLILAADEEAELAGVMAHETAHVCAHHSAREMTKAGYMQIAQIGSYIFIGGWTGYGIYEASQLAIPLGMLKFSRDYEAQADWLGVQYMYRSGYDPQAFIAIFEKLDALEKHKPNAFSAAFSSHPQTPDRIARSEEEIATILPAKPDYMVTTSEYDDIKARLARIQNKRKIDDKKDGNKPTLRRTTAGNNDPTSTTQDKSDDRPVLGRRD